MIPCISVANMRCSDAWTIEHLVPSLELMHRAAMGVFLAQRQWKEPVAIAAGSGNNGGDGYALACILNQHGIHCRVFTLGKKLSPDSAYYAALAVSAGVPVSAFVPGCLDGFDTVVDCLLGTGFQGAIRDDYRIAIEEINACHAFVISVDINSGMNGDTGVCETAVHSDLTVTIGFVKNGLITQNAGKFMEKLVCADIGITMQEQENQICTADEWGDHMGQPGFLLCPAWLEPKPIQAF